MTVDTQLIHFDKARQELELARNIDEVKQIHDQAEVLRQYIRQQKGSLEMQNHAAEIKLRAERRAGEMLRDIERSKGGDPSLFVRSSHDGTGVPTYTDTLKQNDISHMTAYRWQLEAQIPEEKFEEFIAETKAASEELTSKATVRLAQLINQEEVKANPPIVETNNGLYDVIYADPPWQYDNSGVTAAASTHYQTMPLETICKMQIPVADNAVLFMWVTNPFLQDAFKVVENWGFEYKTNIVWIKTELVRPGIGFYVRGQHELLFICTKGSYLPEQNISPIASIIKAPIQEHSKKPFETYKIIETLYPNRKYLELFAREKRDGWESWGNEI